MTNLELRDSPSKLSSVSSQPQHTPVKLHHHFSPFIVIIFYLETNWSKEKENYAWLKKGGGVLKQ